MSMAFLIAAILVFLLAMFGVAFGTIQLIPLGLAFLAASFLPLGGIVPWERR